MKPTQPIVIPVTAGVQRDISYVVASNTTAPSVMTLRASKRIAMRPTIDIASIVPMPRGTISRPASVTE